VLEAIAALSHVQAPADPERGLEYICFESEIDPGRWYIADQYKAIFRSDVIGDEGKKLGELICRLLNANPHVDEAMVERGAVAMANANYHGRHTWEDLAIMEKDLYRADARLVLEAALGGAKP